MSENSQFKNTALEPNNKRDKVKLYSNRYFNENNYNFDGIAYSFFKEPFRNHMEDVTPVMAGRTYEVLSNDGHGLVILVETEIGNITKPIGKWAVEYWFSLEDDPEAYV